MKSLLVILTLALAPGATAFAQPQAGDPAEPTLIVVAPPRKKSHGVHGYGRFQTSASYRSLFDQALGGANIELEGGAETTAGGLAIGARASLMAGATPVGLSFQHVSLATVFTLRLSERWRLGFGPQLGFFMLNRASTTRDMVWTPTIGNLMEVTVDLWSNPERKRVYLIARAGYDYMLTNRSTSESGGHTGTAQLGVGYRF